VSHPCRLPINLGVRIPRCPCPTTRHLARQVGTRYSSSSSSSTLASPPSATPLHRPLTMPRGGDYTTRQVASFGEGRWVPRSVALAQQRAQEAARHTLAPTLAVGAAVPPSEPESAARCRGRSAGSAATKKPQGGAGGATGGEGARRVPPPPLPQPGVPRAEDPCVGQHRIGSRANGSLSVFHHPAPTPRGVNNLGEALATICSLSLFPPTQKAPAYGLWEARLQELTEYA
jgi:hypothetical protein